MQAGAQRIGGMVLAALSATATTSFAGKHDHEAARALRERGEIVPLEQILQAAAGHRPGRVVEVEFEPDEHGGGAHVYEVEVLDARGEVWELKYDARTGALLKQKKER